MVVLLRERLAYIWHVFLLERPRVKVAHHHGRGILVCRVVVLL